MHIASRIPNQTLHTLLKTFAHGWLRWVSAPTCLRMHPHRAEISKEVFHQAEGRGIFLDTVPAEALWHIGQVQNHARFLRIMGKRTVEILDDIDESDLQQLLDVLTDAKTILCNTMETCRDNGFGDHLLVFWATFLRTTQICHIWSLRADPGNRPSTNTKCRMAPIELEANTRVRLTFNWKVRTHVRRPRSWRSGTLLETRSRSPSVARPLDGRVMGAEGSNLWVSHGATVIKCAKEQGWLAPLAEKEMREMMMRPGADDPDSTKEHGSSPRQQDLTGQQPPTTETSKPTSPKKPQQQPHATEQQQRRQATAKQQRQQRPHPQPAGQMQT